MSTCIADINLLSSMANSNDVAHVRDQIASIMFVKDCNFSIIDFLKCNDSDGIICIIQLNEDIQKNQLERFLSSRNFARLWESNSAAHFACSHEVCKETVLTGWTMDQLISSCSTIFNVCEHAIMAGLRHAESQRDGSRQQEQQRKEERRERNGQRVQLSLSSEAVFELMLDLQRLLPAVDELHIDLSLVLSGFDKVMRANESLRERVREMEEAAGETEEARRSLQTQLSMERSARIKHDHIEYMSKECCLNCMQSLQSVSNELHLLATLWEEWEKKQLVHQQLGQQLVQEKYQDSRQDKAHREQLEAVSLQCARTIEEYEKEMLMLRRSLQTTKENHKEEIEQLNLHCKQAWEGQTQVSLMNCDDDC